MVRRTKQTTGRPLLLPLVYLATLTLIGVSGGALAMLGSEHVRTTAITTTVAGDQAAIRDFVASNVTIADLEPATFDSVRRAALEVLGFHARGRWDLIVGVEDCHLASERGNSARNEVREWARREMVSAYDRRERDGVLRNLVVREGRRTGQVQTRLVTSATRFPKPPVDLHTAIEGDSGGTNGPTGVLGEERLREELGGLRLEISHGAFFQTNTEMAERLYAVAAEYGGLSGSERVFDLYCGIGTIGLSMAARAGEVWGLEIVPEAIADAEGNAKRNGIENARFVAGSARTGVRPLLEQAGKPDVVVIDPPRAGLSQKIVRRVIECEAKRIVYVSCNPTTLAPNAAQLVEAGYTLRRVKPVDMFPQTPHIECVALLER